MQNPEVGLVDLYLPGTHYTWKMSPRTISCERQRSTLLFPLKGKEKERKSIYIAPFHTKVLTKRSGMDHTVLPANNTMPAFPSWRSPDVATTATEAADISKIDGSENGRSLRCVHATDDCALMAHTQEDAQCLFSLPGCCSPLWSDG